MITTSVNIVFKDPRHEPVQYYCHDVVLSIHVGGGYLSIIQDYDNKKIENHFILDSILHYTIERLT